MFWIAVLLALAAPVSPRRIDLKKTCSSCHPVAVVRAQRLTREEWDEEVRKMESMGAVVKDRDALLDYLASKYGVKKDHRTVR